MNPNLSCFPHAKTNVPTGTATLEKIIHRIRSKWKAEVEGYRVARMLENEETAKEMKCALPAFTASGVFTKRNNGGLTHYSGIVVIDVDKVGPERARDIRATAAKDPYVLAGFISPSGEGVKLFFRVTSGPDQHKAAWACAAEYFRSHYNTFLQ